MSSFAPEHFAHCGRLGDPGAAPDVYDLAVTEELFLVRVEAALTLAHLGDDRGVAMLSSAMWEERPLSARHYRGWAAKRLLELGAVGAIPDLERAKSGAGVIERLKIARAIRRLKRLPQAPESS